MRPFTIECLSPRAWTWKRAFREDPKCLFRDKKTLHSLIFRGWPRARESTLLAPGAPALLGLSAWRTLLGARVLLLYEPSTHKAAAPSQAARSLSPPFRQARGPSLPNDRSFLKITSGVTGLIFQQQRFLCTWHLDVDSFAPAAAGAAASRVFILDFHTWVGFRST